MSITDKPQLHHKDRRDTHCVMLTFTVTFSYLLASLVFWKWIINYGHTSRQSYASFSALFWVCDCYVVGITRKESRYVSELPQCETSNVLCEQQKGPLNTLSCVRETKSPACVSWVAAQMASLWFAPCRLLSVVALRSHLETARGNPRFRLGQITSKQSHTQKGINDSRHSVQLTHGALWRPSPAVTFQSTFHLCAKREDQW